MRVLPVLLLLLPFGCAHPSSRAPTSDPDSARTDPPAERAVAREPAAPVKLGDSLDEVREQLGPELIEEMVSPSERAISVLYGELCGGDGLQPSARNRAGMECGTVKLLKVTLRNDRVIAVEWLDR